MVSFCKTCIDFPGQILPLSEWMEWLKTFNELTGIKNPTIVYCLFILSEKVHLKKKGKETPEKGLNKLTAVFQMKTTLAVFMNLTHLWLTQHNLYSWDIMFSCNNPNSIRSYKIVQKLSPKHAGCGVAQSPYPTYRHGKACLSKQPPWRAAGDTRLSRGRSRVRALGPAGGCACFFLHPPFLPPLGEFFLAPSPPNVWNLWLG